MKNFFKKLKIRRRAIATLAKFHFFGNPSKKLKIIGVTGTSGKTTTATLLYRIAKELGFKAGLIGSVENLVDGEKMVANYTVPHGTPDPIFLYQLLNKMVEKKCEYVFMEVTSQGMDQDRVAGINFAGGIFTNLTQDHLDYHKDMEDYFQAKKKFFKFLPSTAFALANTDDEKGGRILEGIKARKYTFGFKSGADFSEKLQTELIGDFNNYNTLGVYAACFLLGFDKEKVKNILKSVKPPRGRFEHFTSNTGILVIVDYAHKPDALQKVLDTINKMRNGGSPRYGGARIISLFGCGGERDPFKRPIMGKIGARNSDIVIFTADNPRSEKVEEIIKQMKEGLSPEELQKVKTIPDRGEAIKEAVRIAQRGDIILAAGKGDEDYMIIGDKQYHFDDMEELKKAFQ